MEVAVVRHQRPRPTTLPIPVAPLQTRVALPTRVKTDLCLCWSLVAVGSKLARARYLLDFQVT